jgi:serine protease
MWRSAGVLTIGTALVLGLGLSGSGGASADEPPRAGASSGERPEVLGLIVRKSSGLVSNRSLEFTMERAGADIGSDRMITATIGVIDFAQPLTFAEAAPIAAALEARSDVLAVEPNRRVYPAAAPVIPNDPLFGQQWDMWNGGGPSDYGTRAAEIWGVTTGSPDVIVGIVDTGSTDHPDLVGSTVPGFDFISDAADARDGDRWDSNPADQGDWCPEDGDPSSWHGTHVAGTVNAVQDNGIGVSGLAPGVKVQHLRVLGACGGTGADILAAVVWGSGGNLGSLFGSYPGADPGPNPTPASVLNLSLGGAGSCEAISQEIFSDARARGTTVVVAAGNESESASLSWPANCAGVISVASSTRNGALSGFSNYGTAAGQITLTAPGSSILSTYNAGTTVPGAPDYRAINGTSMATPHVSAAAAILYSFGVTRPSDVEAALRSAVMHFSPSTPCDTVRCGAGLLDVSKLAAYAPATEPGAPTSVVGIAGDARATVSWTPPSQTGGSALVSASAIVSPGGQSCTTGTTTCEITGLTNGTTYTVSVTVTNADGRTGPAGVSAPFTPGQSAVVPGAVSGFTKTRFMKSGNTYRVTVRWQAPTDDGGSAVTGYLARYGTGSRWNPWTELASPYGRIVGMKAGTTYRVQVRAVNDVGAGPRAVYTFTTPRR